MTETSKPAEQTEQLPLSSFYKVLDQVTISKSEKWWEAIVIIESLGRRSIAMYLWQNTNGKWKRKHKFQIRNLQEWEKVKGAVDTLAPKLFGESPQPQP
jgi:hypothetical protein